MQTAFEIIRALKTRFTVVKNSSDEFAFTVDESQLRDGHGSATLRFINPTYVWAGVWEAAAAEWRDLPSFRLPEQGEINEAFIKPIGSRFKVSFTDKKNPLLRWGFTAESVEVLPQEW